MQHADLLIRRAEVSDAEAIMTLTQRAMRVYAQKSGITCELESLQESLDQIRFHIERDYVLIAENRDTIVGSVRLVISNIDQENEKNNLAYFSRFAVMPELQQTGVGRFLYQAAEDYLRDTGIRKIRLHTALANINLTGFYEARGFILISKSNSRGYDRGCYEKNLN
jgi:predicted N-acetyltransferase YhbS